MILAGWGEPSPLVFGSFCMGLGWLRVEMLVVFRQQQPSLLLETGGTGHVG